MYVCVYIYVYMYTYIHTYIYTHYTPYTINITIMKLTEMQFMYVHMHTYTHAYMHISPNGGKALKDGARDATQMPPRCHPYATHVQP